MVGFVWAGVVLLLHLAVMARAILRKHREPASRIAWVVVILAFPLLGIFAYLLLGETSIGRQRVARLREVLSKLPEPITEPPAVLSDRYSSLCRISQSVNGFWPIGGHRANLLKDSNAAIESIVSDIEAAKEHVHLLFYIWLPDNNGLKVVEALKGAARRGVTCRAMVDGLGSRIMIASEHWRSLRDAGVRVATALPIGNPLLRPLQGRIDLRDHRKIVVIDNQITYCGSQNCADPEFLIKAKFAPWVDVMIRFAGPIARQNQFLFISGWMAQVDEDLSDLLRQPLPSTEPGLIAQVIGTGPTSNYSAMPEIFETLMYTAQREMIVTTPYYVPDESMQGALCASARRGVETTIILPAKNDSLIVAAASRSYYADLLEAGVRIFEYEGGLLHTKSLTLDGEVSLIGSANMDRRSFELNYENNVLIYDPGLTTEIRARQQDYLAHSHPVTSDMVSDWPVTRQLWNNSIAMMGPVL